MSLLSIAKNTTVRTVSGVCATAVVTTDVLVLAAKAAKLAQLGAEGALKEQVETCSTETRNSYKQFLKDFNL